MNHHEGVSCNHCSKANFSGLRYKCLRCFDYDLCSACYLANATSDGHTSKHPVQCIVCKGDYDLYYGGAAIPNLNTSQSLTCPYCGRMGFVDVTLKDHITDNHQGVACRVICPICASSPTGDPNYMIHDLGRHLVMAHNVDSRRRISFSVEEQIQPRITNLARNLRPQSNLQVIPAARSTRTHGPIIIGHDPLTPASSGRTAADPIDELILQISRMRRMNNSDTVSLLENRGRSATLQAMRTQIQDRQNLFLIQNPLNHLQSAETIQQEPLPNVPGYAPLLPNILNEAETATTNKEISEARSDFVKELFHSILFGASKDKQNINNSKN